MEDNKKTEDDALRILTEMIETLFSNHYNYKEDTMQEEPMKAAPDREHFPNLYESIEDYTAQTGKRFRMTKEQKSRELTSEQAFSEMYLGGTN